MIVYLGDLVFATSQARENLLGPLGRQHFTLAIGSNEGALNQSGHGAG